MHRKTDSGGKAVNCDYLKKGVRKMQNKLFMNAEEVADVLSISKSYAYKIIKQLNNELKTKGFVTVSGRVNRQYFYERLYGAGKEDLENACI